MQNNDSQYSELLGQPSPGDWSNVLLYSGLRGSDLPMYYANPALVPIEEPESQAGSLNAGFTDGSDSNSRLAYVSLYSSL